MEPGMVFTIEPILAEGSGEVVTWSDGWTAATKDGGWYVNSLSPCPCHCLELEMLLCALSDSPCFSDTVCDLV